MKWQQRRSLNASVAEEPKSLWKTANAQVHQTILIKMLLKADCLHTGIFSSCQVGSTAVVQVLL